ncbi:MAG: hypothetical protein V8T01_08340 [Oscillospiraceae bacterium]
MTEGGGKLAAGKLREMRGERRRSCGSCAASMKLDTMAATAKSTTPGRWDRNLDA